MGFQNLGLARTGFQVSDKNAIGELKHAKLEQQSSLCHAHEHQKLRLGAKDSGKTHPFLFENQKLRLRANPTRKNITSFSEHKLSD